MPGAREHEHVMSDVMRVSRCHRSVRSVVRALGGRHLLNFRGSGNLLKIVG